MATKTKKKTAKKVTDGSDSMKRKVTIDYHWDRDDCQTIVPKHIEALEESAMERIIDQMKQGNTSGELSDTVRMSDEDGEDGIEYSGWWSIDTQVL